MQRKFDISILTTFFAMLLLAILAVASIALAPAKSVSASPNLDYLDTGIQCRASFDPCVDSRYGRNLVVYSDDGNTQMFKVTGSSGNVAMAGVVTGAAEGSILYSVTVTPTVASVNSGVTVVTVPTGRSFRLVGYRLIATGGACAAVTTVDLLAGATKLVTVAQAQLTQSTSNSVGGTGVTILADGASYNPQPLGTSITLGKTGSSITTCTNLKANIEYALE